MKTILFTKDLEIPYVKTKLPTQLQVDCQSFIAFTYNRMPSFPLKDKAVIFTSINGVLAFFKNDFNLNSAKAIYCVGSKTEGKLQELGYSITTTKPNASELRKYLVNNTKNTTFLHFCGNLSLDIFTNDLVNYQKIEVYNTELLYPKIEKEYDAIVFFSPSAVRSFIKYNDLEEKQIFSIGNTTTLEIKNYTNNQIITSEKNTLEDVISLINSEIK